MNKKNEKAKNVSASKKVEKETVEVNNTVIVDQKNVSSSERKPIIFYIIVFVTVLSTLFIGMAGYKSFQLADEYTDLIATQGASEEYISFYTNQYQQQGIKEFGLAGVALTLGIYLSYKCNK